MIHVHHQALSAGRVAIIAIALVSWCFIALYLAWRHRP